MSYQVLIGLKVLDELKFPHYCTALEVVLNSHGGEFCYGVTTSGELNLGGCRNINRIISVNFSKKSKVAEFLMDRNYLKIRGKHILKTIGNEQIIFGYQKEVDPE